MDGGRTDRGVLAETLVMYALMMSYAVSTTIIGAVLPRLLDEFTLPLFRGGIFISVLNMGCLGGILISGVLIDRYGKRGLIFVSYACFIVLALIIAGVSSLTAYLCLLFLAGMASKFMDATLNAGISQLHSRNKGFYMSLLHGSFATGSFIGPLFVGYLLSSGYRWRSSYTIIGLVGLISLIAYGALALRGRRTEAAKIPMPYVATPWRAVLRPRMFFLWLMLFFYCGHEIGLNNWLPTHMIRSVGSTELRASSGASAFWLGLILSRVACSVLTRYVYEKYLLIYGCAIGGVLLLIGVGAGSEAFLFFGAAGSGFFAGGTIPLIMTLGFSWNPGAQGKTAMMLFIAVTTGAAFFPWLMGMIAETAGLKTSMVCNGFMLVAVCLFALCLPRKTGEFDLNPDKIVTGPHCARCNG